LRRSRFNRTRCRRQVCRSRRVPDCFRSFRRHRHFSLNLGKHPVAGLLSMTCKETGAQSQKAKSFLHQPLDLSYHSISVCDIDSEPASKLTSARLDLGCRRDRRFRGNAGDGRTLNLIAMGILPVGVGRNYDQTNNNRNHRDPRAFRHALLLVLTRFHRS